MSEIPPQRTPPRWLRLGLHAPPLLGPIVMVWAGLRIIQTGAAVVGIGWIVVAAITAVLAWRRILGVTRTDPVDSTSGDVPRAEFDYIVWAFVGLPFVLITLLVLGLILDAANGG